MEETGLPEEERERERREAEHVMAELCQLGAVPYLAEQIPTLFCLLSPP